MASGVRHGRGGGCGGAGPGVGDRGALGGTDPDGGQAAPPSATSTASTSAEPSQQAAVARPPSQRDRCREADAELTGQLQAAAPALDQWEIHVAAMNKLVTGEITRAQAGAFWSQSKVDARRNLARFDSAARQASSAETDVRLPDRWHRRRRG